MTKFLCLIVALCALSCSQNSASKVKEVPRDTTITAEKAITNLRLDSLLVDSFISQKIDDKNLATKFLNFYNSRNYQYAWFDEDGLTEQAEAFWNQHQAIRSNGTDSAVVDRWLHLQMDELVSGDSSYYKKDSLPYLEMGLTLHFFNYLRSPINKSISPDEMQWHIPLRKLNEIEILDSFLAGSQSNIRVFANNYYLLRDKLQQYLSIQKNGGWPQIAWNKQKLRRGSDNKLISLIKHRLALTGNWSNADTSENFSDSLFQVIKNLQVAFGLATNGIIDASFISALNIPVEQRIQQIIINLQRMEWLPELPLEYLLANIPEFKLHVMHNGKQDLQMKIVVGQAAHRTVIFSDELKFIVFSPYWNVPTSIVRNEIVPAMNRSKNYLSRNNMEITGYSNGLPVVRQKPGPHNALGKVKFIFPNRYNIYFHDTPAKSLFEKQQRTFSHGCIRLQKPLQLAGYLLRNDSTWTDNKIKNAMNSGVEKWVELKKPIPVYIVYFTAWVDKNGLLNFRDDVYGHDIRMMRHLFR